MDLQTAAMHYLPFEPEAIDALLAQWQAGHPRMGVVALVPEARQQQLGMLQAACRTRGIALAGAVFPALIADAGFRTDGLWLLRLDTMAPLFLLADLEPDAACAASRIADAAGALLPAAAPAASRPTLLLLFDGLVPHIASVLDGLYLRLADQVAYAGANAGSETFQPMPCLFDEHRCIGNGVLGLLLPGDTASVLAHGYPVPERSMTATSTVANRIMTVDWRPAFDAYQEIIRDEYGIALSRENFYQYAVHFPFGIVRANDEVVVRIPVALTDDGALHCVGEVPENAMLALLRAPAASAAGCVDRLVDALAGAHGLARGGELLTFYCAGRRMHLGDDAPQELEQLARESGAARMAGALSLGEIGSTHAWGYPMFHNAALVCRPWRHP